MRRRVDVERARYLGCTLVIGARTVEVYAGGRLVGRAYSISGGRRIVRGYRRAA